MVIESDALLRRALVRFLHNLGYHAAGVAAPPSHPNVGAPRAVLVEDRFADALPAAYSHVPKIVLRDFGANLSCGRTAWLSKLDAGDRLAKVLLDLDVDPDTALVTRPRRYLYPVSSPQGFTVPSNGA